MALAKTKAKPEATKKLATAKKPAAAAKVAKAEKGAAKPKAEKETAFKEKSVVTFAGYKAEQEDPMFEAGQRVYIVSKEKNDDQQTVYSIIAEEDREAYEANPDSVDGDQVFASELAKAEVVPHDPYAIKVPETERLSELLAENNNDPLATGIALQEAAAENMFYVGGALALLYQNRAFLEHGDEYKDTEIDGKPKAGTGWDKFTTENFGMNGRKAEAHIRMYRQFAGIPNLDLGALSSDKKLGWVKLDRIAAVITEKNAEEILDRARSSNVEEVRTFVKEDYVPSSTGGESRSAAPRMRRVTYKLAFFEDQAVGFKQIIELAMKQFGYSDEAQAMEHIATEWASEHLGETNYAKVRKAKKAKRKELKANNIDVSDREKADAALEAKIAESGGEAEGAGE